MDIEKDIREAVIKYSDMFYKSICGICQKHVGMAEDALKCIFIYLPLLESPHIIVIWFVLHPARKQNRELSGWSTGFPAYKCVV